MTAPVSVLTSLADRPDAPTDRTNGSEPLAYRVWARCPLYLEDRAPWKCVGAFMYLQECLDFIAYGQDRGADVIFQSPADVRLIRATDRRVIHPGERCVTVRVEGGCVTDVDGLPAGWSYEVHDLDADADDAAA